MAHHNQGSVCNTRVHVGGNTIGNCSGGQARLGAAKTGSVLLRVLTVVGLSSVTALAGCAKHSRNHFVVGSIQKNYKERHPIVLEEKEQTLDVPVASSSYDLPLASASSVRGFSARFKESANGMLSVMLPSASTNEIAARTIGNKIVAVIRDSGVPANRISMVTYHAGDHGTNAPIRLSYGAIRASVGKCGIWNKDLTETKDNQNYHNFGCASQKNLAAIISNPADLVGPRGTTGIDAARRGVVIEDYRKGAEPNTPDDSYVKITETFGD